MNELTPKEKLVDITEREIVREHRRMYSDIPRQIPKQIFCPICNALVKRQNLRKHLMTHNIADIKKLEY